MWSEPSAFHSSQEWEEDNDTVSTVLLRTSGASPVMGEMLMTDIGGEDVRRWAIVVLLSPRTRAGIDIDRSALRLLLDCHIGDGDGGGDGAGSHAGWVRTGWIRRLLLGIN